MGEFSTVFVFGIFWLQRCCRLSIPGARESRALVRGHGGKLSRACPDDPVNSQGVANSSRSRNMHNPGLVERVAVNSRDVPWLTISVRLAV